MAPRLRALKPMISSLPSRLAAPTSEQERNRKRDADLAHRAWYKTSRWQKLRMSILIRDLLTCQMPGCGRIDGNTSRLVADHKTPHRGDERLFWDENNLQCLCKPCHDRLKQSQERREGGR